MRSLAIEPGHLYKFVTVTVGLLEGRDGRDCEILDRSIYWDREMLVMFETTNPVLLS
jgi:hypothetical protein